MNLIFNIYMTAGSEFGRNEFQKYKRKFISVESAVASFVYYIFLYIFYV